MDIFYKTTFEKVIKLIGKEMTEYIYHGDRLTADIWKGGIFTAVRRPDGKCIRGKNGNMLVEFDRNKVVVLARQLRKINKQARM